MQRLSLITKQRKDKQKTKNKVWNCCTYTAKHASMVGLSKILIIVRHQIVKHAFYIKQDKNGSLLHMASHKQLL